MGRLKYYALTLTITYSVIELLSAGTLRFLERSDDDNYFPANKLSEKHTNIIRKFLERKEPYITLDPDLGWAIRENGRFEQYTANSSGIRSNREYNKEPPESVVRVAAFGDSFTYCHGVGNEDAWPAIMERKGNNLEVLNFGVPAYGSDQAYLRYRKHGKKFSPDIVLIGFMSENIFRNVNTFRPFYNLETGFPFAKPRFRIDHGKLQLIPPMLKNIDDYRSLLDRPINILRKLGEHDYYYARRHETGMLGWSPTIRAVKKLASSINRSSRYDIVVNGIYNEDSEAFRVTRLMLKTFYHEVIEDGGLPLVIVFPDNDALRGYRKDNRRYYAPLLSYLDREGMGYVDLMDTLVPHKIKDIIRGHYTVLGNELVASRLLAEVSSMNVPRRSPEP